MMLQRDMAHISINERLEATGKSAYRLAKQTGVNHTNLAQIRNNKNKAVNLEFLGRLRVALECEPGDILSRNREVMEEIACKGNPNDPGGTRVKTEAPSRKGHRRSDR